MTSITRRNALVGATAAAVVTGAITAPLATMAAGNPDAALLAQCDRLDAALAALTEAHRKFSEARSEAEQTMPLEQPWLYDEEPVEEARKITVYHRHMEARGVPALSREWGRLLTKCGDLSAAVLRTDARTPAGILRKLALVPYGFEDNDMAAHWSVHHGEDDPVAFVIGSIRRDLERLTGEASL